MKRIIILLITIVCLTDAIARTCNRCHGKGRIQTQFATGTYGVSSNKKQCSICGEWISAGMSHWDDCPSCGGLSGETGGGGADDTGLTETRDVYRQYLTIDEYQDFQRNIQLAMTGTKEWVECSKCYVCVF